LLHLVKIMSPVACIVLAVIGGSASLPAQAQSSSGAPLIAAVAGVASPAEGTGINERRVSAVSVRKAASRAPVRRAAGKASNRIGPADLLGLKSTVALVVDQETSQVLFSKNPEAVLPIASLTKLMTALVVVEAGLPLDELVEVGPTDTNIDGYGHSRLRVGMRLTREDLLHVALMSSENSAAHALGRSFPGGMEAFVAAMNRKAQQLGMSDTRYVEPTGLSSENRSSARDLAKLARASYEYPLLRDLSVSTGYELPVGRRSVQFRNTNALVSNPSWDIGLQKTGYIAAAGRCLMMQASLAGRKLIMVFLDSAGKYTRIGDAQRVRRWIESQPVVAVPSNVQPVSEPAPESETDSELGLQPLS
jgi:serine-type D-Ala-D-Ala endopeptidase (penicillin-binding protein 7)